MMIRLAFIGGILFASYYPAAGQHFNPVQPTGRPYPVVVQGAYVNDNLLEVQDEIGVFDGDLCVGASQVHGGWPMLVNTYQRAGNQGGFTPGNTMSFRVYIHRSNMERVSDPFFLWGDGTFGYGEFTYVSLEDPELVTMTIPLRARYFELVSPYVYPTLDFVEYLFYAIPGLAIVYMDDGSIYVPDLVNTIEELDVTEGYQMFCREASEWTMPGHLLNPENEEYFLYAGRWNWLGFPFAVELPIETALEPIRDQVVIIMNDEGDFWLPPDYNTMEMMIPGEGYFAYVNEDVRFYYNIYLAVLKHQTESVRIRNETNSEVNPTGLPYLVLCCLSEELRKMEPAEIRIYDRDLLVGKAFVPRDSDVIPVTTWQGALKYNVAGFTFGNEILVRVNCSDGSEIPLFISDPASLPGFGEGPYACLTLQVSGSPIQFEVGTAFPNPFNPTLKVPILVPEAGEVQFCLFDILGREVFSTSQRFTAGNQVFTLEPGIETFPLSNGMYFLQIQYHYNVYRQKVILIK